MCTPVEYDDLPEFPTPRPPHPVAGCADCARYVEQHADAERDGDASRAADVRVLWRSHKARTGEARTDEAHTGEARTHKAGTGEARPRGGAGGDR